MAKVTVIMTLILMPISWLHRFNGQDPHIHQRFLDILARTVPAALHVTVGLDRARVVLHLDLPDGLRPRASAARATSATSPLACYGHNSDSIQLASGAV